ncbi:hypothetical protein [Saccharopolyspora pogona]|uniref:hypothetical protein n=1 Tax=Saccharopolyspora pogona TaxID=333966 RepID=UPI0016874B85|nr:hypothetical protein [Saccharopolyspora pogona]
MENYELREDELAILADYCQELSLIDKFQAASEEAELLVRASHGGLQANPIFTELRMHRQAAMALWKSLKLPDLDQADEDQEDERVVPMSREESARKAANARWSKSG